MKRQLISFLGFVLFLGSVCCLHGQPNIVFIMADDLGYGDLKCYGQKRIHSPHIDRLAREGIRFSQVYTGSPVCAPSRSVLMTGMHAGHTTVRGNTGVGGVQGLGGRFGRIPLQDKDVTVAEVLRKAGYRTAMIGKWGLGEPGTSGEPRLQGFDYFYGYLNQRRAHNYYPHYLWENEDRDSIAANVAADTIYSHDLMTQKALHFINERADQPFFLYLPYTIPHDEYQIPGLFPYQDSLHWGHEAQVHAAMVTHLDRDIGKLMHLLDALQIRDKTIIFFCSDNGAAHRWEDIFDSSGPLRGGKRDLYEGGIRTPMIVSWPGQIEFAQVSDRPWHFMDVLPTLASLGGASIPVDVDGQDVSSYFLEPSNGSEERIFYWEFYERGFQQAVRLGYWKAIRLESNGLWQLYDLSRDIGEQVDLASDYPEQVAKLAAFAEQAHIPSKEFPKPK